MKKLIKAAFAATVLCAGGCMTSMDTVENAEKVAIPNEVLRQHVETDAGAVIKVTNLIDSTAPNGFLQIEVEFTNTSSNPNTAYYRFEWKDQNGMAVPDSQNHFRPLKLLGRDKANIISTAPNARAKDYKIRLIKELP